MYKDYQELIITPPQTPTSLTSPPPSSHGSSSSYTPSNPLRKMRSLGNLYEVTNPIDDDVTLYCHIATCDFIVLEEAIKDEK
jgi:hypothetical protein